MYSYWRDHVISFIYVQHIYVHDCSKYKYLVNIIIWSSTLPPKRVPRVHKNWSSEPLVALHFGYKDQQRTKTTLKNIFKDTSRMVDICNWCVWASLSSIKVWLSICFSLLAKSLFLTALKTSVSLLSKQSISHENLNMKDACACVCNIHV